jgi:thioredoxin-related protein
MNRFLLFLIIIAIAKGGSAQLYSNRLELPKEVKNYLNNKIEENSKSFNENNNLIKSKGYRVLIISTTEREKAEKIKRELENLHNVESYLIYEQPYFKVKIGDFHSKHYATKLELQLKESYEDCKVVPDKIQFSIEE